MQSIFNTPDSTNPEAQARHEEEIRSKANEALASAIIGIFCCGVVLGPWAYYRANQAINLISEHSVGHQYEGRANAARIIGIAEVVLFVVVLFLKIKNVR